MAPSIRLSVMYVGQPADPAAFDTYYWQTHLPTVRKWPADQAPDLRGAAVLPVTLRDRGRDAHLARLPGRPAR